MKTLYVLLDPIKPPGDVRIDAFERTFASATFTLSCCLVALTANPVVAQSPVLTIIGAAAASSFALFFATMFLVLNRTRQNDILREHFEESAVVERRNRATLLTALHNLGVEYTFELDMLKLKVPDEVWGALMPKRGTIEYWDIAWLVKVFNEYEKEQAARLQHQPSSDDEEDHSPYQKRKLDGSEEKPGALTQ